MPSDGAEGSRHQQRVAARAHVSVEQRLQNDVHIGVGCVDLVHDQQVPRQARRPHVGVLDLERSHHRLVDGTDGDLRREEPLGVLGRPRSIRVVVAGP